MGLSGYRFEDLHKETNRRSPKRQVSEGLGFRAYGVLGFRGLGFRGLGFRGIGFRGLWFTGLGFRLSEGQGRISHKAVTVAASRHEENDPQPKPR